jgi:hypothetical protein
MEAVVPVGDGYPSCDRQGTAQFCRHRVRGGFILTTLSKAVKIEFVSQLRNAEKVFRYVVDLQRVIPFFSIRSSTSILS